MQRCRYFRGVMRWFSLFAILFYLNLLCAPQVFAVHDMRIASLADKQLQALTPTIHPHTSAVSQQSDDDPQVILPTIQRDPVVTITTDKICSHDQIAATIASPLYQARAPPLLLSVY